MKRLLLVLASMASVASTFAQDVIVKRDGEEIQCKILEVSTNKVKYKQWKNQDGPTFVEKKTDVLMLKYENGQKEVISYSGPVSESQVEEPAVAAAVDSVALADTLPISNDYLEYVRKEKSGLLMWGRSISEAQAHKIIGKDWTDFSRAHKNERVGRAMIFTGGALLVGGGVFTAVHIKAVNDYNDKKSAYDTHVATAQANYSAAVNNLNNNIVLAKSKLETAQAKVDAAQIVYNGAKEDYELAKNVYQQYLENEYYIAKNQLDAARIAADRAKASFDVADSTLKASKVGYGLADADVTMATDAYNSYVTNGEEHYNTEFYNASYLKDLNDAENYKKATLYPMIGCYASGAALLVWGIIKEKRAHEKVKQIVNRHNEEDAYPGELPEETGFKPEFDLEGRKNGLALVMKF